eukprot:scaffold2077_cov119-Cylindrotheca_fusiformis.AAC.17
MVDTLSTRGGFKTNEKKASMGRTRLTLRRRKVISSRKLIGKKNKLPSFKLRSNTTNVKESCSIETENTDDCLDLPCDTLLAIQSLHSNSEGLYIPLTGNHQVPILLESQVFSRFEEHHASGIMSELESLIQSNEIRQLSCQEDGTTAVVLTSDYIKGVWDAHRQHSTSVENKCDLVDPLVVSWFVESLNQWTTLAIPEEAIQASWKRDILVAADNHQTPISFSDALRSLLKLRLLLREPKSSATTSQQYYLWLPEWGLVLKRWNEARQQMLALIARSKGGEISERNGKAPHCAEAFWEIHTESRGELSERYYVDAMQGREYSELSSSTTINENRITTEHRTRLSLFTARFSLDRSRSSQYPFSLHHTYAWA